MQIKVIENPNPNGPVKMNFIGIEHPQTEEEVIPVIQSLLSSTVKNLKQRKASGSKFIDLEETIGFLEMISDMTEPTKGYIHTPNES